MKLAVKGVNYNLSAHALERMIKRGISVESLVECLTDIKDRKTHLTDGKETRYVITGRNKLTAVITKTNVIVTVYNFRKEYYASKTKNKLNKKRRALKRKHGNRLRN
mgnify:CR=1 FL=1